MLLLLSEIPFGQGQPLVESRAVADRDDAVTRTLPPDDAARL
jgi:hypothetical protein